MTASGPSPWGAAGAAGGNGFSAQSPHPAAAAAARIAAAAAGEEATGGVAGKVTGGGGGGGSASPRSGPPLSPNRSGIRASNSRATLASVREDGVHQGGGAIDMSGRHARYTEQRELTVDEEGHGQQLPQQGRVSGWPAMRRGYFVVGLLDCMRLIFSLDRALLPSACPHVLLLDRYP